MKEGRPGLLRKILPSATMLPMRRLASDERPPLIPNDVATGCLGVTLGSAGALIGVLTLLSWEQTGTINPFATGCAGVLILLGGAIAYSGH